MPDAAAMNTMTLPPNSRGEAKPSVNIDEPDSRIAPVKLTLVGHSTSANPIHRQISQKVSRLSRNIGADMASRLSRRGRSSTRGAGGLNTQEMPSGTILGNLGGGPRGVKNDLVTLPQGLPMGTIPAG